MSGSCAQAGGRRVHWKGCCFAVLVCQLPGDEVNFPSAEAYCEEVFKGGVHTETRKNTVNLSR